MVIVGVRPYTIITFLHHEIRYGDCCTSGTRDAHGWENVAFNVPAARSFSVFFFHLISGVLTGHSHYTHKHQRSIIRIPPNTYSGVVGWHKEFSSRSSSVEHGKIPVQTSGIPSPLGQQPSQLSSFVGQHSFSCVRPYRLHQIARDGGATSTAGQDEE